MSIILFTGGLPQCMLGYHPPSRHTPRDQAPPQTRQPLHSACWEIRSTSGCYASYWNAILLLPANEVWGKVIFLHLSVILFTGGGVPGPRGLLRGGCLLLGGGGSAPGGGAWWRPLLRAVRILLECILVSF